MIKLIYTCLVVFIFSPFYNFPAVFAQNYVVRDIKQFGAKGDGKTNDHEAFKKAALFFNERKGHGKLLITTGTYIVGKSGTIGFEGADVLSFVHCEDLAIVGQGKVLLKLKDGLKIGSFEPVTGKAFNSQATVFSDPDYMANPGNIIAFKESKNIKISNLSIDGNNRNMIPGGKFGDVGFQVPACGLYFINTIVLTIFNVNVSYCGQDGMMLKNSTPQLEKTPDQKIVIRNSKFQYNGRQGFSWVGGVGLTADSCDFSYTGRGKFVSSPGAGVDIEAEGNVVSKGRFTNCTFIDNAGVGMVADSGPSSDCSFTSCTFWGISSYSMWTVKPKFLFTKCNFYGSIVHGCDAETEEEATVFKSCLFEDKPYKGVEPYGNFLAESNGRRRMRFENCTFSAHKKRLIWNDGNSAWTAAEMPLYKNCTLNIYDIPFKKPDYFIKLNGVILDGNMYNFYIHKKDEDNYTMAYGINTTLSPDKKKSYYINQ